MHTIEGRALTNKELRVIEPDEEPAFAARPMFATVNDGEHWQGPLLLLTDRRLIISKDKLIGRPKADFAADWSEVSKVRGEPWNGGGPLIQLVVQANHASIELIMQPQHAVEVESAIHNGYSSRR
ncbi:MAG TPA: hypothetical protein VFQ68_43000 [Streptosporangiaceae bacterium]|nr:hypothetical protein [Streptosporangiaceae bacterium]